MPTTRTAVIELRSLDENAAPVRGGVTLELRDDYVYYIWQAESGEGAFFGVDLASGV